MLTLYIEYMNSTKFDSRNRGTMVCEECGVLSWAGRQENQTGRLCEGCFDSAGYENEHMDGEHTSRVEPKCPTCNPAGEDRRLARAAERVAQYQTTHQKREADAMSRREAAAAKEAAIKRCAGTNYRGEKCEERAPASSDYCTFCRGDHAHSFKLMPKSQREHVAILRANCGQPALDPKTMCALCANDKGDAIHI